jgi:hypothetical protein
MEFVFVSVNYLEASCEPDIIKITNPGYALESEIRNELQAISDSVSKIDPELDYLDKADTVFDEYKDRHPDCSWEYIVTCGSIDIA